MVSLSSVLPLPPLANHTPAPPSPGSICSAGVKGSSDLKPPDIYSDCALWLHKEAVFTSTLKGALCSFGEYIEAQNI